MQKTIEYFLYPCDEVNKDNLSMCSLKCIEYLVQGNLYVPPIVGTVIFYFFYLW